MSPIKTLVRVFSIVRKIFSFLSFLFLSLEDIWVYIDNIKLEEIYGNYSTLNTFVLLIEISSDAHWSDIRLRWNLVCRLYCNLFLYTTFWYWFWYWYRDINIIPCINRLSRHLHLYLYLYDEIMGNLLFYIGKFSRFHLNVRILVISILMIFLHYYNYILYLLHHIWNF